MERNNRMAPTMLTPMGKNLPFVEGPARLVLELSALG